MSYQLACIISGLALFCFIATGLLALYAVYHGVWKYLPVHIVLMIVQFSIVWLMNYKFGP